MTPIMHEISVNGRTTIHTDADAAIQDARDCLAYLGAVTLRTTFRQDTPLGPVNRVITTRF